MNGEEYRPIIRQEIARALRMLADLAKEMGRGDADGIRRVADALDPPEPELKPCPFCGGQPVKEVGEAGCRTDGCVMFGQWFLPDRWNRRAEVPHG